MKTHLCFKQTVLAAAISLAFAGSAATADEVQELIDPNVSEVAVKLQHLNKVNPLYRSYYGLNDDGLHGSVDVDIVRRSPSGQWLTLEGRDLGLNTQELEAAVVQQGDWGIRLGHDQIPRYAPFKVNTGATGIGSNNVTLAGPPAAGGPEHNLKTKRTATSLAVNKFLSENLQASFSFKNEDRKGARLSGINGTNYRPGTLNNITGIPLQVFAPEPIDSTHQQFEAALDYGTDKYQLSAGYYGSFFENNAGNRLGVQNSAGAGLFYSPALAPDNQAQEFYVSGGYRWSDDTRGTVNIAKTFGEQKASFVPTALITSTSVLNAAAAGQPAVLTSRTDLGGKVETTNAVATLSSRITRELSLTGSVSYDEHKDKTPKEVYVIDWGHGGDPLTNNPESFKTTRGKLEGSYRLPADYRLNFGYTYEEKHYEGMEEEGFRDKVDEDTYRLELAKSLSETLNGAVTLTHGKRKGSTWGSTPVLTSAVPALEPVGHHWTAPTQFSDRERDKARLMLDWTPLEALSLQFAYEYTEDTFETRHLNMGLNDRTSELYSLDAIYQIADEWKANLWYSYGDSSQLQNEMQSTFGSACNGTSFATMVGATVANTCLPWSLDLKSKSESVGAGISGKVASRADVGARLLYAYDVNKYDITVTDQGPTSPLLFGAGTLPDTSYTLTSLQLFGSYALAKATSLRLDYVYDRRKLDDYAWAGWSYSDGTTVHIDPDQTTHLVGLSLIQQF